MCRSIACTAVFLMVSSLFAQPTTQRTRQDSFEAIHQFKMAEGPEAYRAFGVKSPAWDEDAIAFLTMRAESQSYGGLGFMFRVPKLASDAEQRALGQKLLDAGCNDPQVLYQIARVCDTTAERRLARKLLTQVEKSIDASGYSSFRKYTIARFRLDIGEDRAEQDRRKASEERYVRCLADCLTDKMSTAFARDVTWDALTGDFDNKSCLDLCAAALAKAENHPNLDPWLYHSLAGKLEISLAWKSRGGGWASTVTPEGWQGFYDHLAKAREHLTQAWNLDNTQPQPAAEMITVAMGAGDELNESIDTWFTRATAAQFDYAAAYSKYRYAIQPKWGGSVKQLDQFATKCLNTQRFDSLVPNELIRVVYDWYAETNGEFDPSTVPGLTDRVLQCCDGYIAAGKERGLSIKTIQTEKLAILYSLKRFKEARAILDELNGQVDPTPLESRYLWMVDVLSEIYAMTGSHAPDMQRLLDQSASSPPDKALADAKAYLQSTRLHAPEEHFVRTMAADLEFSRTLASGKWIDLPTENDLSQWRINSGNWTLDHDRQITCQSDKSKSNVIVFLPRLPKNFEISCTVDVANDPDNTSYGRVYMAYGDLTHGVYGGYSPQTGLVGIGSDHQIRRSAPSDANPKHFDLAMKVQNGKTFTCTIDGKASVIRRAASLAPGDRQRRLALAINGHPSSVFRFSNLRIRMLPTEAEPDERMKR